MIKFYVHVNQLHNFLIYKEPVELNTSGVSDKYVELIMNNNKLIFTEYTTYITVELKTFKKGVKQIWTKIKNKFKRQK